MATLRRLLGLALATAGTVAAVVLVRRRFSRPRARIDLYYEDGTMLSFEEGSPQAERMLFLAYEALRAVGPGSQPRLG
ncbi:MAG: hypothetical protein C4305_10040 [Thermoleophilia bacterium]